MRKKYVRRPPRLTEAERRRRAQRARTQLLPRAIRATGRKGFYAVEAALEKHRDAVTDPTRLAGWLKAEAYRAGVLSPRHKYRGRRGYRKYPEAARRMTERQYQRYLRAAR